MPAAVCGRAQTERRDHGDAALLLVLAPVESSLPANTHSVAQRRLQPVVSEGQQRLVRRAAWLSTLLAAIQGIIQASQQQHILQNGLRVLLLATKHADLQAVPAVPLPAAQQPNKTTALKSCETADADGMQQPRPHNPPPLCHCLPMCLTWLTWLQNPQQVEQCVVLAHAGEIDPESCSHALLALCACPGSQGSSRQKSTAAMRMGKPSAPEMGLLLEVGSHPITLTLLVTPLQGLEQHRSLADT